MYDPSTDTLVTVNSAEDVAALIARADKWARENPAALEERLRRGGPVGLPAIPPAQQHTADN